jgi:hypothetical protein
VVNLCSGKAKAGEEGAEDVQALLLQQKTFRSMHMT